MHFIYEDNPIRKRSNKPFSIEDFDATEQYLKHFGNSLELAFFLANGNREEKQRASKELAICDRKMLFWKRAPNFDIKMAANGCDRLKRKWSQ